MATGAERERPQFGVGLPETAVVAAHVYVCVCREADGVFATCTRVKREGPGSWVAVTMAITGPPDPGSEIAIELDAKQMDEPSNLLVLTRN